jgi:hypothetical protein
MAANPVIKLGGDRAHMGTTVLGLLKKKPAEPRSCLGKLPDHREAFCGPAEFTDSAHGGGEFTPIRSDQPEFLD